MTTALHAHRDLPLLAPEAGLAEAITWSVAHAVLAPSELNTQPWRFRALVDRNATARIDVLLDRSRLAAAADPSARLAVLACGAALLDLRLALRGAALGGTVRLCPDPATPDLLAEVHVRGPATERPEDRLLREAIGVRGARGGPAEPGEIPDVVLDHLLAEAAYEGALVVVLNAEQARACGARGLLCVGSPGDDRPSLLRAGAGLQRLLLAATTYGITCRFVNDGLRHPDQRAEVARLVELDHPQVLLQLGFGQPALDTDRRAVSDVLTFLEDLR